MTYNEFKNKYNGQYVDTDRFPKENPYQCFDLAQQYFTECLGLPPTILKDCKYVKNMLIPPKIDLLLEYFDEVSRFEMQPGDVAIWSYEPGGHIAMFDNYDGRAWYFSHPAGSNSHLEIIPETNLRAFRPKKAQPQVTPNVARDENKNQIEVKVNNLNVRTDGTLSAESIGVAKIGYYDYYETKENDGYTWYRIDMWQWVAYNENWINVLPAKIENEYYTLNYNDILENVAKKYNTTVDELMKLNKFNYPNDENIGLRIRVK